MGAGAKKRGRPRAITPEKKKQALALMEEGATDQQVAAAIGVHVATLYRAYLSDKDFCEAEKKQKAAWDRRVEQAVFLAAVGELPLKPGCHPASSTDRIWWLKNRQPDKWRDRHDVKIDAGDTLASLLDSLLEKGKGD